MPTENIKVLPYEDRSPVEWDLDGEPLAAVTHGTALNPGTSGSGYTPLDTTWSETQTADDEVQVYLYTVPDNVQFVTQIAVNIRAWIDDADSETDSYIELRLFHSSGTAVTGNPKTVNSTDLGGQRVIAEVTKTWTGLNLTKAEANTLELRMTLKDPS